MKSFFKKISYSLIATFALFSLAQGATILFPSGGGTGTNVPPTVGQVLLGQSNGTYLPVATSSLGISGGVTSVFGRTGAITASSTDYSAFYVPYTGATGSIDFNAQSLKNFFISKTADATAKFTFDVGNLSTATTRTVTVPNRSFTLDNITASTTSNLTAGSILFSNGSTIAQDNSNFFWDSTNHRLGIGTASPSVKLHISVDGSVPNSVFFNSASDAFLASNLNASTIFRFVTADNSTATNSGTIVMARSRGTLVTPTIVSDGDQIGSIAGNGFDGSSNIGASRILFNVDGTPSNSVSMPGRISFLTTPSGSETLVERMRITNAGNVGIGTSAPNAPLQVVGKISSLVSSVDASFTAVNPATNYPRATFVVGQNSSDNNFGLNVIPKDDKGGSGTSGWLYLSSRNPVGSTGGYQAGFAVDVANTTARFASWKNDSFDIAGYPIVFSVGIPSSGTGYDVLKLNADRTSGFYGNVGIGTTTPSARLHAISTTEQLRLGYDSSNYISNTVGSTGILTVQPSVITGGTVMNTFNSDTARTALYINAGSYGVAPTLNSATPLVLRARGVSGGTYAIQMLDGVNRQIMSIDDRSGLTLSGGTYGGSGSISLNVGPDGSTPIIRMQEAIAGNSLYFGVSGVNYIYMNENGDATNPMLSIQSNLYGGSGNVGIGLGSGFASASARLHVIKTTEQLRLGYDVSNYFSTTIGSTGSATFNLTGTTPTFTFNQKIIHSAPTNLKNYTVATLPTGVRGDLAYCTDLLLPTRLGIAVGGGAVVGIVFYDGTNWITY